MKWKNRMIALLLAFVLLLAGCRNGQLSATDDATVGTTADTTAGTTEYALPTDETTESTEPEIIVTCQYLPETIENPSNLPVMKWVCMTSRSFGGGTRTWNEEAAVELNQMLADRNMPFRIQFVLLTTNRRLPDVQDWFTFPEVQQALENADLIYGDMTTEGITQYLTPITEYVTDTAEPTLKNAVAHEVNWLQGTVDGEIYGYGTYIYEAYGSGWTVSSDLLFEADLTAEDFAQDFWEMDDVFAKLYQANGNQPFLAFQGNGTITSSNATSGELRSVIPLSIDRLLPDCYDGVGSCFIVDYSGETPVVGNYLEMDKVRKLQEATVRYAEANYFTENPNYVGVSYGNLYAQTLHHASNRNVCILRTDFYFKGTGASGLVSGVAAASGHKAEAIALLNLIAEDEVFRMQLFYGKEGRDYKIEDGYYTLITQEDGSNYSLDFLSPLSYFCGLTSNPATADMKSPGTENWGLTPQDGKTALQAYRDIVDSSVHTYPIIFDYTGFEQELEAMQAVFEKYFFIFTEMTETQYDQMLRDLEAAGSDKVLAELQRQLSEWQKNNPDWPLKPEE